MLKAASRLRPIDQEILRLTLWEELPLADVAMVLDLDPAAMNSVPIAPDAPWLSNIRD